MLALNFYAEFIVYEQDSLRPNEGIFQLNQKSSLSVPKTTMNESNAMKMEFLWFFSYLKYSFVCPSIQNENTISRITTYAASIVCFENCRNWKNYRLNWINLSNTMWVNSKPHFGLSGKRNFSPEFTWFIESIFTVSIQLNAFINLAHTICHSLTAQSGFHWKYLCVLVQHRDKICVHRKTKRDTFISEPPHSHTANLLRIW